MTPQHAATLVKQAAKCVGGRGSPTIQTGLLVELDSGGRARFTGCDRTTCLTMWEEGFLGKPTDRVVVDPRGLREILNHLTGDRVHLSCGVNPAGDPSLSLRSGAQRLYLRIHGRPEEFQTLPDAEGAFCELSPEDLGTLERVAASCGSSELPGHGNSCVHLLRREDTTLIAATDGHRIAFCRRPLTWGGEPPATVAVPADALRALKGVKPDGEHPVLLVADAKCLTFTNGCFTLTTTQGNADRGAQIERVLGDLKPYTATAGCDAAELRAVLLRAGVVAKRNGNRVDLEELPGGKLAVAAECDVSENHRDAFTGVTRTERIQASFSEVLESGESYAAKRLPIAVDFRYLKDCLPKTGGVILGFQGDLIGVVPDDEDPDPLCWILARMKTAAELNAECEAAKRPAPQAQAA